MELATLQRQLLGLIKFNYQPSDDDDPYIRAVAQSEHLEVLREIVIWWRAYGLQRYCPLTSTLLKRRQLFDDAVRLFISKCDISPFIEKLGPTFLEEMSDYEDSLVASMAQFELALIKVKKGDPSEYLVAWQYEPYTLLNALLNDSPLDLESAAGQYQTIISHDLPQTFQVFMFEP